MSDALLRNTFTKIIPGYEEVADYTATGTIANYDFTGLNITKEDDYILVSEVIQNSNTPLYIQFNDNYTNTNYWEQRIAAVNTTLSYERQNAPWFGASLSGGQYHHAITSIKLTNSGYISWNSKVIRGGGSTIPEQHIYNGGSTFTATSITSIRLALTAALVGSRFRLYKRVAPIVYDYIVSGAAITNLDITGLALDKNSEYIMKINLTGITSSGMLRFFINANYTTTNYYTEYIKRDSTTPTANRDNTSNIGYIFGGRQTYIELKIKITNSGRMIYQSNENRYFNSNIINAVDWYGTGNFTATTITSMRFSAETASIIGIGSRFQLIKLR